MAETVVTPNNPSTVVTSGGREHGYYHPRGLEGKDVAAINEMFTLQTLRGVTTDIHQTARDIEVNVEKSGRSTELAVEKTAAASMLFAANNTSAIRMDLAEDACEIKELIREDGQKTRDLINANSMAALRDQLAASANENTLLKLKIGGIAVPV